MFSRIYWNNFGSDILNNSFRQIREIRITAYDYITNNRGNLIVGLLDFQYNCLDNIETSLQQVLNPPSKNGVPVGHIRLHRHIDNNSDPKLRVMPIAVPKILHPLRFQVLHIKSPSIFRSNF